MGGIIFSRNVASNNHGYPIVSIRSTSRAPISPNIEKKKYKKKEKNLCT
jgi:hypothetical protein